MCSGARRGRHDPGNRRAAGRRPGGLVPDPPLPRRGDADAAQPGEALLAFGKTPSFSGTTFNLSPRGDLIEAAANLFSHLRALDASGAKRIAVMKVPHDGLGEAINDRLKRAAAPRR